MNTKRRIHLRITLALLDGGKAGIWCGTDVDYCANIRSKKRIQKRGRAAAFGFKAIVIVMRVGIKILHQ